MLNSKDERGATWHSTERDPKPSEPGAGLTFLGIFPQPHVGSIAPKSTSPKFLETLTIPVDSAHTHTRTGSVLGVISCGYDAALAFEAEQFPAPTNEDTPLHHCARTGQKEAWHLQRRVLEAKSLSQGPPRLHT